MLQKMKSLLAGSEIAQQGLAELSETLQHHQALASPEWNSEVQIDFTLARGLNYYTGFIAEVVTSAAAIGSIGGGGRYDDLTGLFGLKGISGVGISFGVDRIYDVLDELALFPDTLRTTTQIIFLNLDPAAMDVVFGYIRQLRKSNIPAEFYMDKAKMDKQMKYADKRNIPFVAIIGESELQSHTITVKNMENGTQEQMNISGLIALFSA
jgi:histidyl-tRNA synthetase